MNTITQISSRMISEGGSVEYILDLLEDPDDARKHLRSEMTAMGEQAQKSLDEINQLTQQFNDWYWVICCLKSNTFDGKGKSRCTEKEPDL